MQCIVPGKVEVFNVVQDYFTTARIRTLKTGTIVILVFDTDKNDISILRSNLDFFWNQAVDKSPEAWQASCERADRLKKLGMTEEAMADYEHCFSMQKASHITDGLYSLAQMHESRQEYQAAIADYERIIRCIREEHNPEPNTETDRLEEEIRRLKRYLADAAL